MDKDPFQVIRKNWRVLTTELKKIHYSTVHSCKQFKKNKKNKTSGLHKYYTILPKERI